MIDLLFGKKKKENDSVTEHEIISIVDEAHEKGVIEKDEAEMIQNIISFGDIDAGEVMTRRSDIRAIDGSQTLRECTESIVNEVNSRFPVYEDTIDSISGVITLKDVMREYVFHPGKHNIPIRDIPGLIREAAIFPESRSIESILQHMRSQKTQMVLIVDEYGQIAGIVTMEDILEEIVGNILDEYDREEQQIRRGFDNSFIMDGMMSLDRAAKVLGLDLQDEDYETLNGYLTSLLGHIPTDRDRLVKGSNFLFHILKVEHHTIRKVRAVRIQDKEER